MIELNKTYCMDAREGLKLIPDESIDLIACDGPYLINYSTNHRINKNHDFCSPIDGDDDQHLIIDIIPELYRVLKPNTALYIFCSWKTVDFFKPQIERYFKIKNLIIFDKQNWTAGDLKAAYGNQYEMIIYANKGRRPFNGKRIPDIWSFPRVAGKKQLHQNQKPVDLMEQIIEKSSNAGDIVLDPFIGSGTTAVACQNTGRNYLGFEINEEYVTKH
ncbi:MAG: site-specific DNA-methyltransferase [Methanobacterium sp.]|nr:MAG: site-specific DNA-methyltransferase [Methanobacterium sp.]